MLYTAEHRELMASIRRFVANEIDPFVDEWEANEIFPAQSCIMAVRCSLYSALL